MRENKISISIFIVFFLFISGFSQSKMSKSVYNNFLSLNPLSELNIEQEIIDIISTLKDEKNGFIYCNDLKKGFFNVVKNEDGYIIQIFDGGGEKKSNVVKLKDIIKVLKKTKSKYSNDFNEQNLFNGLKSKSKCEIICNKELYNNNLIHGYTDIVMSAKWSPMFIDLEILKNVVPSGQTKILNRQRTREFMLDPNNNPANLYLDITDGVIVPDNNGNSAKIFTVDKDCHRVVFCNKDISPNNTNQYFCGFGHYGTNVNEFRYPTGITAGPPFDGYRLFYIAEYANNRIQQIGYKLNEAGQHYFGWNDIIKSNLSSPYDIVFHYGATTSNSNDDVIWFSEQGAERRIQCINKYGSYIFSFTKYIYNGFVYPISPTRLDLYSEYQNGQAIKTILAFINEYNNKIVLIHLDNQGYLSSSDPPEAFCVIDHPYPDLNGSVFSSIKFITNLTSSITNPVSLLATTKGQYGDDGEIHKYKILFHPASQWTDPVAVEYIGTVSYLTGNQTQPFHRLKNIETVYNYADIFSMEDWSDQYGLRRFRQKVDVQSSNWGTYYLKNYGIDWNVRVSSPVKIQLETYYCLNPGSGNEYWNSVTSKVNGITTNQFFLTTGNNYYSINLNMPQNINYNNPIKIKIKANIFPIVNETNPIDMTTSEIMKYITVNPPWGGCPFLYTLVDSNYFEDNNILYKSELENNIGQDITDKYILSLYPDINPVDSTINLKFSEKNDDYSYFDQVKLFAIDHSIDTKVGVTENNDIVLYSPIIISSPDDATQNGDDVTDDLQYEKNDTTYVDGNPNDTINASFSLGKDKIEKSKILKSKIADCFKYIQKVFFQKEFSIKNEIFIDSFAVVLDSWNINNSQTSKNIDAGIITGYESDGSFTSEPKPFTRRQNYSNVIVPISGDDKMIDSVSILWDRDYSISYIGVTPIIYGGYIETELPLVEAVNSNQENLLEHISNQDGDYAQMEKGNDIILKFKCNLPDVQIGMTRDYCFVITGRYNSSGDKIVKTNKVINNNLNELPKTYELSQNYPNPFNPNTTIKFALPKDGFVALKIYDVAGREIVNLVNEYKKAGYYSTQFNGNQFASGVYFYRIQAGNFVQTKKMVLIK